MRQLCLFLAIFFTSMPKSFLFFVQFANSCVKSSSCFSSCSFLLCSCFPYRFNWLFIFHSYEMSIPFQLLVLGSSIFVVTVHFSPDFLVSSCYAFDAYISHFSAWILLLASILYIYHLVHHHLDISLFCKKLLRDCQSCFLFFRLRFQSFDTQRYLMYLLIFMSFMGSLKHVFCILSVNFHVSSKCR